MKNKRKLFKTLDVVVGTATLSSLFLLLNATGVYADSDVVDEVTVTIPISCSITSTVGTAHTATVEVGTYEDEIGETTFNVLCNDSNGFAVYAVGFSDDTLGNTAMKPSTLPAANAIATGTATSGNTSNWAMKLTAVSGTYAPTLATGFNAYHAVPDEYTKVASFPSNTDAVSGSSFKSTYAVYISQAQPADTYTGKVKYTVVHPASINTEALTNAVTLNFDANGLAFSDGSETNTVQYAEVCDDAEYVYIGSSHQDIGSSNLNQDGTQGATGYSNNESVLQTISSQGADKLKVVIDYGLTGETAVIAIIEGAWDGDPNNLDGPPEVINPQSDISGTETFYIDSDTVTIYFESWDTPESDYDYGFFAKVYPVYETQQANTTPEELPCNCYIRSISGSYEETTNWKGRWDLYVDGYPTASFNNESELLNYINTNYDDLKGSTITISAYNPMLLVYDGNGASSEFSMGAHGIFSRDWGKIAIDLQEQKNNTIALIAPNFKRSGYGFIGWSLDSNAANNLSTATIYGPNEIITIDDTFLNNKGDDGNITLYATWLQSTGNIQNWSGCSNMSIGGITALIDTRDSNTYAVAKLEDGNCWMIENLRLGSYSPIQLSTSNTQSAGTLPAAVSNDYSTWSNYQDGGKINIMNLISPNNRTVSTADDDSYSFGTYYTYMAAINTTTQPAFGEEATTSICPSGWALPSSTAYSNLINTVGNAAENFTSFPNNFVTAGHATGSTYSTNRPSNIYITYGAYTTRKNAEQGRMSDVYTFIFRNNINNNAIVTSYSEDVNTYYGATKIGYGRPVRCLTN